MENDSQQPSLNAEAGGEVSPRRELDYGAGLLSAREAAEVEAALADTPEYRARLKAVRDRVAAMATPEKASSLAERLRRAWPAAESPAGAAAVAGPSPWRRFSTALRELLDAAIAIPTPELAWCATPATSARPAVIDFVYPVDGSLEIRVISPELGDEGAVLLAEIRPLPPRFVKFARRAPSSFEVEGRLILTAEEHRRLPAERTVILREPEPAR
jgi:hypothetical protein